jgi:hypothetical protein
MNLPDFTAERSVYLTGTHFYSAINKVSAAGTIVPALIPRPSPGAPIGDQGSKFLDSCGLKCWLRCRYVDQAPKHICDLLCACD